MEGIGGEVLLEDILTEVEVQSGLELAFGQIHEGLGRPNQLVHLLLLQRHQILKQRLVQIGPGVVLGDAAHLRSQSLREHHL